MASTNRYPGLPRGAIDNKSSSLINCISNGKIDMGAIIGLSTPIFPGETLPRVEELGGAQSTNNVYGIAVGGDVDGVYGDGSNSVDDSTRATNAAGQGVVILTQGRCLAKVVSAGGVVVGSLLSQSGDQGVLEAAVVGVPVIATSLFVVASVSLILSESFLIASSCIFECFSNGATIVS